MQQKQFRFTPFVVLAVLAFAAILLTCAAAAGKYRVLQLFSRNNGASPFDSPIFDLSGNLYGTTYEGGTDNFCVVYKLTCMRVGAFVFCTKRSVGNRQPESSEYHARRHHTWGMRDGSSVAFFRPSSTRTYKLLTGLRRQIPNLASRISFDLNVDLFLDHPGSLRTFEERSRKDDFVE